MNFINRPENPPRHVTHRVFYSKVYSRDIGFNIYLPPDYDQSDEKYPVAYHLHGWTGDESTEIGTMEKTYVNRRSITVFPNSSPVIEQFDSLPVESMMMDDLIPHIDAEYRTEPGAEGRSGLRLFDGRRNGFLFCPQASRAVHFSDRVRGDISPLLQQRLQHGRRGARNGQSPV